ncbi:multiple epidermal growth factor-like domains protein 10 [Gigantopelta aegis]|uniref:multiple epidermal growth factor-like domains protein 10 n=1 Tax=Gigantopelta aegis TaxID=1735272 RepID=UPI001B88C8E1|nr:multiple epidermal growth factor-like domains protein 10 [Gigantopelta aegis]
MVRLYKASFPQLVYISGNIALKKTAYQSSFYIGHESQSPRLAIDGDLTQGSYAANCILAGDGQSNSWWEVDLQRDYYIHNVVIHFRTDYTYRKPGVHVYSSMKANQSNAGNWCGNTSASSPNIETLTCDDTARYITLFRSTGDKLMSFCEVEVYVCDAGTFGDNCTRFCHCLNGPCDYVTGECSGGCKPNWSGHTCNVCDSNHYGELCREDCSTRHCVGSSTCDSIGRCDNGCTEGWMQPDCTTKCSQGLYGHGCRGSCVNRHCHVKSDCDHVTGECVGGCNRGYNPLDCTSICQRGTFGPGCQSKCSERHCKGDSSSCDVQNGTCQHGCDPGWKSLSCNIACDRGSYGAGCKFSCSQRHCKVSTTSCNNVNGYCEGLCQDGWMGVDCTVCDTDHYGVNCESICADRHCKGEQLCHHELGYCNGGCVPGWTGLACVEAQAVTGNTDTGNSDSAIVAVSVVAGILFVLLVIVTSVLIWHIKTHRVKSDSYQQEMKKTNTNPSNEPTDPSAVEYEIVDRQDGGRSNPRIPGSQQVDTSRSANDGNSPTSHDQMDAQPSHFDSEGGYVNASQTNEYETLDLSNPPQNDYDRITGV